eukprot:1007473-Pleurochrysis_carterae.AAC.1
MHRAFEKDFEPRAHHLTRLVDQLRVPDGVDLHRHLSPVEDDQRRLLPRVEEDARLPLLLHQRAHHRVLLHLEARAQGAARARVHRLPPLHRDACGAKSRRLKKLLANASSAAACRVA